MGNLMKKSQSLKELRKVLAQKGLTPETIDSEITSVSAYFDEEGMEEIDIPVEDMADEISALISEQDPVKIAEGAASDPVTDMPDIGFGHFEIEDAPEVGPAEEKKAAEAAASTASEEKKESDEKELPTSPEPEPELRSPVSFFKSGDKAKKEKAAGVPDSAAENKSEPLPEDDPLNFEEEDVKEFRRGLFGGKKSRKSESSPDNKNAEEVSGEEEKAGNDGPDDIDDYTYAEFDETPVRSPAFTVLFILAIPLILALALIAIAIYLVFWVFLALLLIAIVALLIAFVAAGVTVSLVGIVYGVIMMIKGSVPVGLFEIGLGVTVGAVVLFVGILVYNFAVRLIPFAMKMLAKLLGFAFTKTKEGLRYIKKLIARAERQ